MLYYQEIHNIQKLFFEHLGGRKGERNLRIALINFLVMRLSQILTQVSIQKKKTIAAKLTDLWSLKRQY